MGGVGSAFSFSGLEVGNVFECLLLLHIIPTFFETALRSCIIDVCMKRGQRMAKNIKKISILRHGLHLYIG